MVAPKPKSKKIGRDPVDVIWEFQWLQEQATEQGWGALHKEVLAMLKRAKRPSSGAKPTHPIDRDFDIWVMARTRARFRGLTGSREERLHEASEYGAALDKRPKGKGKPGLTYAAVREWLEHPGRHPKVPPFVF